MEKLIALLIIRTLMLLILKNSLDGKTNEHTSMVNNFCGFAIIQIRLKIEIISIGKFFLI